MVENLNSRQRRKIEAIEHQRRREIAEEERIKRIMTYRRKSPGKSNLMGAISSLTGGHSVQLHEALQQLKPHGKY